MDLSLQQRLGFNDWESWEEEEVNEIAVNSNDNLGGVWLIGVVVLSLEDGEARAGVLMKTMMSSKSGIECGNWLDDEVSDRVDKGSPRGR